MDLRGRRFGSLLVTEPTEERKNGYTVWRCQCDCGGKILVDYRRLIRGTAQDCGCGASPKLSDLRGRRFGRLVVQEDTGKRTRSGEVIWRCQCDCGNETEGSTGQLNKGYKKSCGCLGKPPRKDWVGKQFGDLTVLRYAGKQKGCHLWHCRCSCGKELDVRQSNLQSGHTTSCGCKASITNNIHFVEGTSVEAIRSKTIFKNNTSGVRGVYFSQRQQKWCAQITFRGKSYYLGSYAKLEDAAKARARGEECFDDFLEWYDNACSQQEETEDTHEQEKG